MSYISFACSGGGECLAKPFGLKEFRSLVDEVLARSFDAHDRRLGNLALRSGFLTKGQLKAMLGMQSAGVKDRRQLLGEIGLTLGFLTHEQLEYLLLEQRLSRTGSY